MADRSEETCLRLICRFGGAFGRGQRLVQLRKLLGSFADTLFQAFVGVLQRAFGFAVGRDVTEAHYEAAAWHRVADELDHAPVGEGALRSMRAPLAHPVKPLGYVSVSIAGAETPTGADEQL